MKNQFTDLIVNRLTEAKDSLKSQFFTEHPIDVARHFALDNLLPTALAQTLHAAFPNPKQMHLIHNPGKIKLKYTHLKEASSLLQDINAAIQDPRVVAVIEDITQIKHQIPDPTRFAGGISTLTKGYYINPHLDNSHDADSKRYYRTVNVLYYLSPDWNIEHGGHYELWDDAIENHILVPSFFNRLVVMETHTRSWHAVSPVRAKAARCCVFNYYFSEHSPEHRDYFFDAPSFKPRPEQTIRRTIEHVKESVLKYFK